MLTIGSKIYLNPNENMYSKTKKSLKYLIYFEHAEYYNDIITTLSIRKFNNKYFI